jgi:hypothetical protein
MRFDKEQFYTEPNTYHKLIVLDPRADLPQEISSFLESIHYRLRNPSEQFVEFIVNSEHQQDISHCTLILKINDVFWKLQLSCTIHSDLYLLVTPTKVVPVQKTVTVFR